MFARGLTNKLWSRSLSLIADRPCLLFWFECSNNLAICPLLLFTSNSLFHSFILKTWDNLDFLKRKLSMLFVLIHRIIFHDKNLMDEEILKTASNASSQAMTELLSRYFSFSISRTRKMYSYERKNTVSNDPSCLILRSRHCLIFM